MNETFQADRRPLRLEWWRFFILATLIVGVIGAVTWFRLSARGPLSVIVAMAIFAISLVVFFGLRWHRLRAEVAAGSLNSQEFHADPRSYILGPKRTLVIWFACTLVVMIGIIVCDAL